MKNDSKIKVLHIGMSSTAGGIEKYLLSVLKNIDQNIFSFCFLVHGQETMAYEKEILELGGKIYRINNRRKRFFNYSYCKELRRLYKNHKFHAVEYHMIEMYDIFPIIVAKHCNIPVRIIHSHANAYWNKPSLFVRFNLFMNKYICGLYVSHKVGCSSSALSYMFGKNDGLIIKNGIDKSSFFYDDKCRSSFRKKYNIDEDITVFSTVGRLHSVKNQAYLLQLFMEYNRINNKSILMIAGVGPEYDNLKKIVSYNHLEKCVFFLGFVLDTNSLYNGSDFLILTSVSESYSIVLFEALFTGLDSIISFETDCTSSLIHRIDINMPANENARIVNNICRSLRSSNELKDYSIEETIKVLSKLYV